jgi:formylglycine-generating enzyme
MPLLCRFGVALGFSALSIFASCSSDSNDGGASDPTNAAGESGATTGAQGGSMAGTTGSQGGRPAGGAGTGGGGAGSETSGGPAAGGADGGAGSAAGAAGLAGAGGGSDCELPDCKLPSCAGLQGTECQGGDCCKLFTVEGGTFEQGEPDAFSSTIDSFALDELEVTVARFRPFVAGYDAWRAAGNPKLDAGENAHVPDSGWKEAWTASLPADDTALEASLACESSGQPTWAASGHDALPINCVDWFVAFAFCIWDGGRLPTDAEAEYAAAGGSNDFPYPWGTVPSLTDLQDTSADYAVYHCLADGSEPSAGCTAADLPAAGSRPNGRGVYQQLDLVGSVWEWSLDYWTETYPTTAQKNYAKLDTGTYRAVRGGSYDNTAKLVNAAARTGMKPTVRYDTVGFRCARNLR